MNTYLFKNFKIELHNDPIDFNTAENENTCLKHYAQDNEDTVPVSKHGIRVYKEQAVINSCILIAWGGSTCVHKTSALLSNNQLLVCCGDTIFCLQVPSLKLNWRVKADMITCFQIYALENDFLVHGETEISRIDGAGKIKWRFSGSDIFVSHSGSDSFQLSDSSIQLTDFNGNHYQLDFDGKTVKPA